MSFESCKKQGLIKPNPNAKNRIDTELNSANKFFNSAKNIMNISEFDLVFLSSYNSCFHFLRALLYKNGFVEKSHYCLVEALKSLYSKEKRLLSLLGEFDMLRRSRHDIQYRGIFSDKKEAKYILEFNEKLKVYVEKNLRLKKSDIKNNKNNTKR